MSGSRGTRMIAPADRTEEEETRSAACTQDDSEDMGRCPECAQDNRDHDAEGQTDDDQTIVKTKQEAVLVVAMEVDVGKYETRKRTWRWKLRWPSVRRASESESRAEHGFFVIFLPSGRLKQAVQTTLLGCRD